MSKHRWLLAASVAALIAGATGCEQKPAPAPAPAPKPAATPAPAPATTPAPASTPAPATDKPAGGH